MSTGYTTEQIETARQLAQDLQEFNNKALGIVANCRVTDKSRSFVIMDLLVKEFGLEILNKNVFNPFGSDTLTQSTNYRQVQSVEH